MRADYESPAEEELETVAHDHIIPQRELGRTGASVSILGLGGGGLFFKEQNHDQAMDVLNRAIDLGINYLDTAPTYGVSELHYGEVMAERRGEVFLATKVHPRSRDEAWSTIERSLRRLQTDHVDLIQVHDIKSREEVDRVMADDGSLAAILQAREQGLVRWVGVTGHSAPDPLLYALERFDFDTVLMPVNVTDRHYLSFIDEVMPTAHRRHMGVIGMKVYCAGGVFEQLDISPRQALSYALSQHVSTAVVGVENAEQLLENIETARRHEQMPAREQREILARTKDVAQVCSSKFKLSPE